MATISQSIKSLKLRNKLALGYIAVFTALLGLAFFSIYTFSERYREEEFYQRLKDKTLTTFKILLQVDEIDRDMLQLFDRNTINSLNEEKVLLYDSSGRMIYNSHDDRHLAYASGTLKRLRSGAAEIRVTRKNYELLGTRFNYKGQIYYGVTRAYDLFGKSKLRFLKFLLMAIFVVVTVILVVVSFYLSELITAPITRLTKNVEIISPDDLSVRIQDPNSNNEVGFLASKFNELLDKVESAFKFQYHFIHHLSHELKTPLAVMMTNAERALADGSEEVYKVSLEFQKSSLMELSYIINAMMDISKTENQLLNVLSNTIRLDELLFECMDEISFLNKEAGFDFVIDRSIDVSDKLTVMGNSRMLKMALMNLLKNAINFSLANKPEIALSAAHGEITISVSNDGPTISEDEQKNIFRHLFRGANSRHVKGFGLGLVLTNRIISLHKGSIHYLIRGDGKNCFTLRLPLA